MIVPHHRTPSRLAVWLLLVGCVASVVQGQEDERPKEADSGLQLPPGVQIDWLGTLTQTPDGEAHFTGPVTITWKDSRMQADRLTLTERRYIEAEGNVLIIWGQNRMYGTRMTYDLETERGVIENALGQALGEYMFWAKSVKKIGESKLHLKSATVTTCTQPLPYWSFSVSSATITIEKYARMWNVRLRTGRAPIFYLPYLVWPVKEGRAAGLLMPEVSSTRDRGNVISQELFIPIGRSADLTLEGRHYSKAGFGGGGKLRVLPNRSGSIDLSGFYIQDDVAGKGRYRAEYNQTQKFRNGFRMLADLDFVSDFNYYNDFERDLKEVSSPSILARLEFSRNGPWASVNVRELRREQLSSGLVQQTLPEIEWRGRSKRLGRSPIYLSFEASAASIQQKEKKGGLSLLAADPDQPPFDPDYLRGDLFPTFTLPWSPVRWMDITPTVSYRLTHYTQRQEEVKINDKTFRAVDDDSLTRGLWSYGVELVGPKLYKIYQKSDEPDASRYKHTIEARVRYGFAESFDDEDEILLYDEVDQVRGFGKQMNYALVQRLFAKRPRAKTSTAEEIEETVMLADGTIAEPVPEVEDEEKQRDEKPPASEPVEIASLEISQRRSFDQDISREDVDEDGTIESFSRYSPIQLVGRFNPTRAVSLDLRSGYNILFKNVEDVTISGTLSSYLARLRFSLVHINGLGVRKTEEDDEGNAIVEEIEDSTQLQLTTGATLLGGRLKLNLNTSYNANPADEGSHFPDQRWQLQYGTQCCTFFVERLTRDFAGTDTRRELHFRVDLTGVGKVLSKTF